MVYLHQILVDLHMANISLASLFMHQYGERQHIPLSFMVSNIKKNSKKTQISLITLWLNMTYLLQIDKMQCNFFYSTTRQYLPDKSKIKLCV
jgi:hypothetical protein